MSGRAAQCLDPLLVAQVTENCAKLKEQGRSLPQYHLDAILAQLAVVLRIEEFSRIIIAATVSLLDVTEAKVENMLEPLLAEPGRLTCAIEIAEAAREAGVVLGRTRIGTLAQQVIVECVLTDTRVPTPLAMRGAAELLNPRAGFSLEETTRRQMNRVHARAVNQSELKTNLRSCSEKGLSELLHDYECPIGLELMTGLPHPPPAHMLPRRDHALAYAGRSGSRGGRRQLRAHSHRGALPN